MGKCHNCFHFPDSHAFNFTKSDIIAAEDREKLYSEEPDLWNMFRPLGYQTLKSLEEMIQSHKRYNQSKLKHHSDCQIF